MGIWEIWLIGMGAFFLLSVLVINATEVVKNHITRERIALGAQLDALAKAQRQYHEDMLFLLKAEWRVRDYQKVKPIATYSNSMPSTHTYRAEED